jgi:hypothetical protein
MKEKRENDERERGSKTTTEYEIKNINENGM